MFLRVEMKSHYRSVYLTSIIRHSEKAETTSARMPSKFLQKLRKWPMSVIIILLAYILSHFTRAVN